MPSIELADLQQRVYGRLGSNTLLYPLPEVTRSINYSIACLNAHTGMLQGTLSGGTTTANCLIYPVPAGILVPFAVRFGGVSLRRCSVDAANLRWQTWMSHTSAGYGSVAQWIPLDVWSYALHPADSVGGIALKVTGILEPTPLVNPTDVVSIAEEFVEAVTDLASHSLQLKEGGSIFSESAVLYQQFLARVKEWTRWKTWKGPRFWVEDQVPKKG